MAESFSVGDVVEVTRANQLCTRPPVTVGMRGTIVQPYVPCPISYGLSGGPVFSRHDAIRRVPPPAREQTSTWDDLIVWRPKETANV